MARQKITVIQSRLGQREVDLYKTINFPRGLIGYEDQHLFTLLRIREGAPLLILQSMDDAELGLLVADPYAFIPEYSLRVGDAEQKLLKVASAADLAILVTATIPPGRPEETALNLLGPILINHKARLGIQVPQTEGELPARVFIHRQNSAS
ncbi:MAG: flagellar assembly protein FliW [Deltaproteobacteria bacterium]|jgi:flagellar assembly factor FliW|nr:flagellar assembly protein FliW [Deltaproteobacteria bacterium]